jgi:hypothetical protein
MIPAQWQAGYGPAVSLSGGTAVEMHQDGSFNGLLWYHLASP